MLLVGYNKQPAEARRSIVIPTSLSPSLNLPRDLPKLGSALAKKMY